MQTTTSIKQFVAGIAMATCLLACNNDKKDNPPANDSIPGKQPAMSNESANKEDIVLTRTINAPVEAVYQAWTDPKKVMRWWGPRSFTSPTCSIDLREGGKYIFSMRPPGTQGPDMYTVGTYTKVVSNQYLEFGQRLSDKDGNAIDPATIGMPADFPKDPIRTTIALETRGTITIMTVTEYGWKTGPMRDMSASGLGECLDKLVEYLLTGKTM
jgi:uncharacterized protein YndB with AHSA1/START domain